MSTVKLLSQPMFNFNKQSCRMGESIEQVFEDFIKDTMGGNSELDFSNGTEAFSFTKQADILANSLVNSIYVDASAG